MSHDDSGVGGGPGFMSCGNGQLGHATSARSLTGMALRA